MATVERAPLNQKQAIDQFVSFLTSSEDAKKYIFDVETLKQALNVLQGQAEGMLGAIILRAVEDGRLDQRVSDVFFETIDQRQFAKMVSQEILRV